MQRRSVSVTSAYRVAPSAMPGIEMSESSFMNQRLNLISVSDSRAGGLQRRQHRRLV